MADDNDFVERTIGDWTAYQDDGRIYYHNGETGESSWDPPPGFEDDNAGTQQDDVNVDDQDDNAVAADGNGGDFGARTPSIDGDDRGDDLKPTADDAVEDDGITQSPPDDGITQSPDNDGFGQSPTNDGITQSPTNDGITQSPTNDGITQSPTNINEEEEVVDGQDVGNGWVAYKDDEGLIYYYNADSGETQWDRPGVDNAGEDAAAASATRSQEDMKDKNFEASDKGGTAATSMDSSPQQKSTSGSSYSPREKDDEIMDTSETTAGAGSPLPKEEPENTAATAEEFLQQPDAVMEPSVLDHISILVQELGPQVAGPKALQSLMNGYSGDTAVCGLMGLWLAELKSLGGNGSKGKKGDGRVTAKAAVNGKNGSDTLFQEGADAARDVAEEVVNRLAKERFTKDGGDAIVKLAKKEAAFIDKMIKSERWRKLLIDLSATNKDSKLFMYCLQSISNLGHHRAIANRINQSDYFGVFNSMLQSELSIAAKIAVDGYTKEVFDSIDTTKGPMGSLIADLRRTCTSTSYTYLYAMEVLSELLSQSNKMLADGKSNNPKSLKRAIRKWERLREELEDEMLKPQKAGTIFQRKRRIDVSLTMSDLFQRKRRRVDPRAGEANGANNDHLGNSSNSDLANTLDLALSQLLTKNSLGVQIDKEIADNVLKYAYGGSTDQIGDLLIKHPTAITALLNNLFGSKRVRQLETRLKCARLVALATTASERSARSSSHDHAEVTESDEDVLSQVILKGSQLCEQAENMVSFTVLDNVENAEGSVGRQLSAMCIQHPVVAQGVLIWAKELASGADFVTTASYPTVSPSILSLTRLICRYHPLTRPAVLEIPLIFMGHSFSEISHKKMQSIKEQCLRLMMWLSTQGLSLAVLSAVQNKLEKGGSSEMDSALVRYFFTGILEIVRHPFSLAFVRALGTLMMKRPCVDALLSKHFEASKQGQIVQLVNQFESACDNQKIQEEDKSLLSMLKSTYCASKN